MTKTTSDKNPLARLHDFDQSFWLDQISRSLIQSGELARLRDEDGLRGVTSNPSIFMKAITGSDDYDDQMRELMNQNKNTEEIYEGIAIRDIQNACDVLRPVYNKAPGADGFVSLEVSPLLADDTEKSIADVRRLSELVARPNLLVKVPATPAGLPVIEQMLYEGISINVTLIFSLDVYEQVANTYVRALESRVAEGQPVDRVASVASFFVSRIDVLIDKLIEQKVEEGSDMGGIDPKALLGKSAVACAKIAYERFKTIFHTKRFQRLEKRGARVQRPLWASTSTKNPDYKDVMYIEPLIGPQTVNTIPLPTAEAFRDHGIVKQTVEDDLAEAHAILENLTKASIDLDEVTQQLLDEGVQKFITPFEELLASIEEKRKVL